MDLSILEPNCNKELEKRIQTLNQSHILIYSYENSVREGYSVVEIINKIKSEFGKSTFVHCFPKKHYEFKGGGTESIIGFIPIGMEGDLGVVDYAEKIGIPVIQESPENYEGKFIKIHPEVHLIDKKDLEIPRLVSRLSYFVLPAIKYVEQDYIQELMRKTKEDKKE